MFVCSLAALVAARAATAVSSLMGVGGVGADDVSSAGASVKDAFRSSFVMILITELGDKTFFIAALLAMSHGRLSVFLGAAGALAAMTVLSSGIGLVLPHLLPREYTHWAAVALFVYFGCKLVFEAFEMIRSGQGAGPSGELKEAEQTLAASTSTSVVLQALTLTFLAEWGDRSQLATIAMAAANRPLGVMLGGIIGHSCSTSLAVFGGRALGESISERCVVGIGGLLFLAFATHGALVGVAA